MSQAWIAVGLVIGAYLNYRLVAPRLRTYTELANDAITVPDFLEERFEDKSHTLRLMSALVIIVFFTLYTSAGMVAGGKFAVSAMGMDYTTGILLMGGIVVAYTALGGFLAVSLTDFVQGCIMFLALVMVPVAAWLVLGSDGIASGIAAAEASRGLSLTSMIGGDVTLLTIISAAAWGLGYFGQPHIIVRFMAIRRIEDMPTARRINIGWMSVSLLGAVATGYVGAAYFAARGGAPKDAETVFILLSQILFHPLVAGFTLAAILAAIMSTISSQLLVTSSSLTEDIYKNYFRREASERELVTVGRLSVALVSIVAGVLALDPESSILGLVGNAWAGFGAAFGPVILFSLAVEAHHAQRRACRHGGRRGDGGGVDRHRAWRDPVRDRPRLCRGEPGDVAGQPRHRGPVGECRADLRGRRARRAAGQLTGQKERAACAKQAAQSSDRQRGCRRLSGRRWCPRVPPDRRLTAPPLRDRAGEQQAGKMRRGHRGAADGVVATVEPRRLDRRTGLGIIDRRVAEVRVAGPFVANRECRHGVDVRAVGTRRRVVVGIVGLVAGGKREANPARSGIDHRRVERGADAATEAHVGDVARPGRSAAT